MSCIVLTVRQILSGLMVEVNLLSPELADYHVARMTDTEVEERLARFIRGIIGSPEAAVSVAGDGVHLVISDSRSGAELSVAGPKSSAGNVVLPGPRPCDERWQAARHSTLFPEAAKSKKPGTGMPDSEVAKPGPKSDSERSAESEGYEEPETLATFGLV